MFTDEEFLDILTALDIAIGVDEEQSPLTPYGIQKFTVLREKVQSLRDAAPNPACSGRGGTLPETGEYFVEYVESNVVRLTPRR